MIIDDNTVSEMRGKWNLKCILHLYIDRKG